MTFIKKIAIGIIKCLLYILDEDHRVNHIIDDDFKKFTDIKILNFNSDHNKASKVMRTVPYELWEVKTKDKKLIAADKHIVIKSDGTECYMENLKIDDELKTDDGTQKVIGIKNLNIRTHTYDLELNGDHLYYSDGILSHNTTCAAAYLLWFTMFFPDKTVLICANKLNQALEIMDRIKYGYENLDKHQWLRPGIVEYNKGTISFDNGSSIIARATTKDAGRGLSISLLYLDEFGFVNPRVSEEFWAAISPVLSTGGDCIITSTPNSDEDKFAQIWFGALQNEDEYGNPIPDGVGANEFFPVKFPYSAHPDRDEKWAMSEMRKLGEKKFLQEHACIEENSIVTIKDGNDIKNITIGELYSIIESGYEI